MGGPGDGSGPVFAGLLASPPFSSGDMVLDARGLLLDKQLHVRVMVLLDGVAATRKTVNMSG